jgi:hypothetical protein
MYVYMGDSFHNFDMELVEQKQMGSRMPKAKIKSVLQTVDDVNKNKRIYPKNILERALTTLSPMIQTRTLLGELDHPVLTGNNEADGYRHFVVLYDNVSHIIEKMWIDGTAVMGTIETTLTDNGFKMAGLIMDGVKVGFSVRALGESKSRPDGVTEIAAPFEIITYDCVSNPSHSKARMVEVVKENFDRNRRTNCFAESDILVDRMDLVETAFNSELIDGNNLENMVTELEKKINQNKYREADRQVDNLLTLYLNEEEGKEDRDLVYFLDEYINGEEPIEKVFKKYFKV